MHIGNRSRPNPPPPPQQPFAYIIYKRGLETVAQKYDGSSPIHSPSSEVVIQSALDDPGPRDDPLGIRAGPGHIHILDGIYDLNSSSFKDLI